MWWSLSVPQPRFHVKTARGVYVVSEPSKFVLLLLAAFGELVRVFGLEVSILT